MTPKQSIRLAELQKDILVQQFKPRLNEPVADIDLGPLLQAFPTQRFPCAAVHEFCVASMEELGSTNGFIAAVLSALMGKEGISVWIGSSRMLFPPALAAYGIDPSRIIFITLAKEKDILWAMEEALKCEGFAGVIAELRDIDFKTSRRLQLAVEKSRATGFVIRPVLGLQITACVTRWRISPMPSHGADGLPGVGFPRWNVSLLKVRNGKPGQWKMEWADGQLTAIDEEAITGEQMQKRAG